MYVTVTISWSLVCNQVKRDKVLTTQKKSGTKVQLMSTEASMTESSLINLMLCSIHLRTWKLGLMVRLY